MYNPFLNHLGGLPIIRHGQSRAINAENPLGEKGRGGMKSSVLGPSRKGSPCIPEVKPGETVLLGEIDGCGVINHIWMTVTDHTPSSPFILRDLVLRIYWDGEFEPSVECPLGDFFCNGFGQGCVINSLPIVVNPTRGFNSFFPMPFRKGARLTLENQFSESIPAFFYQIDYTLLSAIPNDAAYFHAQWRRQKLTTLSQDYVILDQVLGAGHYIGTYMAISTLQRYWWGEGEFKFYLDGDTDYPTICGTGTEDYFGGAWSFATQVNGKTTENLFQTPFMGYPYYSIYDQTSTNPYHNAECPPMRGLYRWHIMDPICFEKDLKVTVQQIGVSKNGLFERQDDVSTVAYWYQNEPHQNFPKLPVFDDRRPR